MNVEAEILHRINGHFDPMMARKKWGDLAVHDENTNAETDSQRTKLIIDWFDVECKNLFCYMQSQISPNVWALSEHQWTVTGHMFLTDLICLFFCSTAEHGSWKRTGPNMYDCNSNVAYLFIYLFYCREAYITVQTILWQTYNTNVMIGTIISTLTTGEGTV